MEPHRLKSVLLYSRMRVAILTISDSVSRGTHKDASGPGLRERCARLGWEIISEGLLADNPAAIRDLLVSLADSGSVDVILTTGGTGIGPRDSTPEATTEACDKVIPGLSELMREECRKKTPRAVLSRAVAGVRGRVLIVNLPGSPRGAIESLDAVADLVPHALQVLGGARHDS